MDLTGEEVDPATASALARLLEIMARLRDPVDGCPWDQTQTFASIAPCTIEEAFEVADAIERQDMDDLKDELGDLLLQVVYHSRMAEEAGFFAFKDVADAITSKLIRRHPHVFESKSDGGTQAVDRQWESIKRAEREEKAAKKGQDGALKLFDDIPIGLPAILRSAKLQRRASRIGFDWPSVAPILDKVDEELAELRAEIAGPETPQKAQRQSEEFGDLMFVLINLGLRLGIDAEAALRSANSKFTRRMEAMEIDAQNAGTSIETMSLDALQELWDKAKTSEATQTDAPKASLEPG